MNEQGKLFSEWESDFLGGKLAMSIGGYYKSSTDLATYKDGFTITGDTETWKQFLGSDSSKLMAVRTYVYLKVKIIFDPPQSSAAIESINRLINEFEWRLNVAAEK